ncbi:MAG: hypothetical protein JST04_06735 [Bdellovibrionales bacterium]|nr:hypothetical protein [Bdellovibrionales bacterium]
MLKVIGWLLKASFFTALVLVAAHYVTWDGKTVSDQVNSTLSHADKSAPVRTISKKSKSLLRDAKEAASRVGVRRETDSRHDETIPSEDRESLQALIHSSDAG